MKKEKLINNTGHMATLLDAFKLIAGDLRFLHGVLYDENGDEDERRKVEIALPYIKAKAVMIETFVADYSKYLPADLKKKLDESHELML